MTPPTAPERCPTCDKPKGDQARADAHPLAKQWSAWIAMVPGQQRPLRWRDVADAQAADQPGMCIESQCQPVDWRARTYAAEDAAAQWAKVAPLIERLRHTRRHTKPEFVVAAIDALLAATAADKARAVEAARPTLDEARRLVDALEEAAQRRWMCNDEDGPAAVALLRRLAADCDAARAALLAALTGKDPA